MLFFNKNTNESIEYKVLEEYKNNIGLLLSSDDYISRKDYIHFYDANKEIYEKLLMMDNEAVLQSWCKNNRTDYPKLKDLIDFYTNTKVLIENHNNTFVLRHMQSDKQYLDEILLKDDPNIKLDEEQRKVVLSDEWIESIRKTIPMLPNELKSKYKELGINDVTIKSLIQNQDLSIALNELIDSNINPILSANILTSEILSYMNSHYLKFNELNITLDNIKDIVNMLSVNKISSKIAKEIISELLENGGNVGDIINKKGLSQISDVKVLKDIINNILNNNPKAIEDYNNGLDRSIKFLMGQIMKETKGQANPKLANDMLIEELKNRS